MRDAAADAGRRLGIFYVEERRTYRDNWDANAQMAKSEPARVRGLDSIIAALPDSIGQDAI